MTTSKPKRIRKPRQTAKHRDARPTIYHEYWGQRICEHIASGWSLVRFCNDRRNPSYTTVMQWLRDPANADFVQNYARARDDMADAAADRTQFVAEQSELGLIEPNAARVAIDGYKWQAAIRKPKKYGQRLEHVGGGKDGAFQFVITQDDEKLI